MATAREQQEGAARPGEGNVESDPDEEVREGLARTRAAVEQERRDRAAQALA
ncbi:MAG: hypothetical protein M3N28_08465 [Actinomycetota bacterium]|nr:hypothetical protein [Actinomycetota bacterium]